MTTEAKGAPRRKVISADKGLNAYYNASFNCTLECGHRATGQGRAPSVEHPQGIPPKTVACYACKALEKTP